MRTTGEPQDLASLYKKMAAVMASLQRIPKRGYNSHFKYEYVTDSDVMDAVRLAMGAAGLGFFNNLIDMEQDSKRTLVTVDATFADGDTGATMTVTWVGEALDTQDKGINKALTGAVKYGLLKTFLISTGEDDPDDDGEPKAKTAKAKSNGGKPKTAMHEAMADAIAPKAFDPLNPDWALVMSWDHFMDTVAHNVEHYNHAAHVKNALAKIYPDKDAKKGLTYQVAWTALIDHANAPKDEVPA